MKAGEIIFGGAFLASATVLCSPPGVGSGIFVGIGIGLMLAGLALWLDKRATPG